MDGSVAASVFPGVCIATCPSRMFWTSAWLHAHALESTLILVSNILEKDPKEVSKGLLTFPLHSHPAFMMYGWKTEGKVS